MPAVDDREAPLLRRLAAHEYLVVAFSGGVDSSYLLAAAVDVLGDRVTAATAVSPSLPAGELVDARATARTLGATHVEVRTDEMDRAAYRRNDRDRCWHCKTALFDALDPLLASVGDDAAIAVGTIVDDLADDRPGQRAAAQRGVLTPLADAGLRKNDVRDLSRLRGLPTWDKPAAACLASRVVYGLTVTPARLSRVERAEAWLRDLLGGGGNLRVRDHGDTARVEVDASAIATVAAHAGHVAVELRRLGWTYVSLDLEGFRSGSLNAAAPGHRPSGGPSG